MRRQNLKLYFSCLFIICLESALTQGKKKGLWFGHTAELLPACFSYFMFALGIKSSNNVNTNNCGGLVQTHFLSLYFQTQHFSSTMFTVCCYSLPPLHSNKTARRRGFLSPFAMLSLVGKKLYA